MKQMSFEDVWPEHFCGAGVGSDVKQAKDYWLAKISQTDDKDEQVRIGAQAIRHLLELTKRPGSDTV